MKSLARFFLVVLPLLLPQAPLHADEVAISSKVFNGYTRERLADGTFKPEFYVFGEGGAWTRPVADPWLDKLTFTKIGHIVARPLAKMNYHPAFKAADAELLILVFWGSTEGSSGVPDAFRQMLNEHNAQILGYNEAYERAVSAPLMSATRNVIPEISANRYYVVLQAFDFKASVKDKKLKPLWVTRMSVGESGYFDETLAQMVQDGSRYFGRDSDGLQRQRIRQGWVDLGPLEVIETSTPKSNEAPKSRP